MDDDDRRDREPAYTTVTQPVDVPEGAAKDQTLGAKIAIQYVPEALSTVLAVMRKPARNSTAQLSAAKLILELAGELAPSLGADDSKKRSPVQLTPTELRQELIRRAHEAAQESKPS